MVKRNTRRPDPIRQRTKRIVVADELGYCWGVRRALDIIQEAAAAAARSRRSATSSTTRRSSSGCARKASRARPRSTRRSRAGSSGSRSPPTGMGPHLAEQAAAANARADRHHLPAGDQGPAPGPEAGPPGVLPRRLRRCVPPGGQERARLGGHQQVGRRQEDRRSALERQARRDGRGQDRAAAQGGAGQPDHQERRRADEVRPRAAGDGRPGRWRVPPLQHDLRTDQRAPERAQAAGRAGPLST